MAYHRSQGSLALMAMAVSSEFGSLLLPLYYQCTPRPQCPEPLAIYHLGTPCHPQILCCQLLPLEGLPPLRSLDPSLLLQWPKHLPLFLGWIRPKRSHSIQTWLGATGVWTKDSLRTPHLAWETSFFPLDFHAYSDFRLSPHLSPQTGTSQLCSQVKGRCLSSQVMLRPFLDRQVIIWPHLLSVPS